LILPEQRFLDQIDSLRVGRCGTELCQNRVRVTPPSSVYI
jgi:hypothetical protein